jgi:hypothetical protein
MDAWYHYDLRVVYNGCLQEQRYMLQNIYSRESHNPRVRPDYEAHALRHLGQRRIVGWRDNAQGLEKSVRKRKYLWQSLGVRTTKTCIAWSERSRHRAISNSAATLPNMRLMAPPIGGGERERLLSSGDGGRLCEASRSASLLRSRTLSCISLIGRASIIELSDLIAETLTFHIGPCPLEWPDRLGNHRSQSNMQPVPKQFDESALQFFVLASFAKSRTVKVY